MNYVFKVPYVEKGYCFIEVEAENEGKARQEIIKDPHRT